jgi:hypothetical protein
MELQNSVRKPDNRITKISSFYYMLLRFGFVGNNRKILEDLLTKEITVSFVLDLLSQSKAAYLS